MCNWTYPELFLSEDGTFHLDFKVSVKLSALPEAFLFSLFFPFFSTTMLQVNFPDGFVPAFCVLNSNIFIAYLNSKTLSIVHFNTTT